MSIVGVHLLLTAAESQPSGVTWWDAAQAIGTVAAVAVALGIALIEAVRGSRDRRKQARDTRRSVAARVNAWVEVTSETSPDGSHYVRRATLHLANESDEPVFRVAVLVGVGEPPVQIGPLAAPVPVWTLPARHRRSWDVTMGLLAHSGPGAYSPADPVAMVAFTDVHGVRWRRDFQGTLTDTSEPAGRLLVSTAESGDAGEAQLGQTNDFNPLPVALWFLTVVRGQEIPATVENVRVAVDASAPGWNELDDAMIESIRNEVDGYGLAAHVWYPAPRVAYVRLVHEEDAETAVAPVTAGWAPVRGKILTMVFGPDGWKVFSVGPTDPDWVLFPAGWLSDDPRGGVVPTDGE